ncbi:hypothetical protein [Planctomyces sp. SH-PL14]|uniref:hypothetical protein n=1 Tax=Planctomyces sp. SH-PL14 TaxID=1632864 RepID=UPI00078EB250|nr:hypothetical protein [Planctomyces sp. SH-PL14]AMV19261.1 hypothetical protein VT03_15325 [Planctomyces sp. SH-PL14]
MATAPIPCFITNRDLLTTPQDMVERLKECDCVGEIVILDCGSTYPPLKEWYASCPVRVEFLSNLGSQALWRWGGFPGNGFYFESDSDLDLSDVPKDFLLRLMEGFAKYPHVKKAGLSLRIDDLPDDFPLKKHVVNHERQFWSKPLDEFWFEADIDTTAALYRGGTGWGGYGPSLRSAPPYTARHVPWYMSAEAANGCPDWCWYLANHDQRMTHWSGILRRITGPNGQT